MRSGSELGHLPEARRRAAAPPYREEPDELVQASGVHASQMPSWRGVLGMSIREETPG